MIRKREYIEAIRNIKLDIISEIRLSAEKLTQRELCKLTGLHQPEVSKMLSGNVEHFSIDRLLMVLLAMGHKPVVYVC